MSNCDLFHLRPIGQGLWLSKTRWGSYAVCEESDGVNCGAITVCGDLENAENYGAYCVDPSSPGGVRWINDHRGIQ